MELTSNEALNMLENARGKTEHDDWINHSICVGNASAKIIESLNLDIQYAKTYCRWYSNGYSI